jgi:hypothetical protein
VVGRTELLYCCANSIEAIARIHGVQYRSMNKCRCPSRR